MTPAQIALAQRMARGWEPKAQTAYSPLPQPLVPDLVKDIQRLLVELGYRPGPADGIVGQRTRTAIREFQGDEKIAATGRVSEVLHLVLAVRAARYGDLEEVHPDVWEIVDDGQLAAWINEQPPAIASKLRNTWQSGTTDEVITLLNRYKTAITSVDKLNLRATGSGFFVSEKGHVLTSEQVVNDCEKLKVVHDAAAIEASLMAVDNSSDLAILQTHYPRSAGVAVFSDNGLFLQLGASVIAAGYSLHGLLAYDLNISTGSVSALAGLGGGPKLMHISVPVRPGSSGGPLLDSAGNVMGVIVGKINTIKVVRVSEDIPQSINFAITNTTARRFLDIYGVNYPAASSEQSLYAADIAASARQFTVAVECWR
jgi:S1-C subfamily serine protease